MFGGNFNFVLSTKIFRGMKRVSKLILRTVALSCVAIGLAACGNAMKTNETEPSTVGTNPTLETIAQRHSVRRYTDQQVSRDTIDTLLKAAMAAPSSKDRRPWQFVVVDDRAVLDTLGARLPFATMLAHVPQALVVCGDNAISESWYLDCAAATQNFLLAAQAMGLAAVWTGVYPNADRIVTVQEVLGLPGNVMPLAVVPFGYGDGLETPKDKYDASRIHYNKW